MSEQIIRVLCVDDNQFVADAIQIKLKLAGGFEWLGLLMEASQLVSRAAKLKPHVVLLDIDMPGEDPFVALHQLSQHQPEVRVVMLSGHVRRDLIERALDNGAWGYISKSEDADTIVNAIRRVAGGEFVLGPDVETVHKMGG